MNEMRTKACCAMSVLAALTLASPAPARACSQSPGFARIAGTAVGAEGTVPLGAGVLIEYHCRICALPLDTAPPEIEVEDADGDFVPGVATWIDTPEAGWPAHALWQPETPLAEGTYELHWIAPAADFASPMRFDVAGPSSETPNAAFEVELGSRRLATGNLFTCRFDSCGFHSVTTQYRLLPVVFARWLDTPSIADVTQFLYRAVKLVPGGRREAGVWRSLPAGHGLQVDYGDPQDEYCVELEAMRVRDGAVSSLGQRCLEHSLGPLGPSPERYATCDGQIEETMRAAYRQSWCEDNAQACTTAASSFAEACGDYAEICAGDDDGENPDASVAAPPDGAGGVDGGEVDLGEVDAGAAVGLAPNRAVIGRTELSNASNGGSCAAAFGSGNASLGALLVLAMASLVRRARERSGRARGRS